MNYDPFYSARLRIARAQEHLHDLEAQITDFFSEKPYARIVDDDPDGVHEIHKIRLTKPFPFRWRVLATEIVEHARSSLDHATWASAYLCTNNPNLEFGVFPFASEELKLANRIKGVSKDCPPEIQALLGRLKPYRGGNDLLFALNDLCNLSKHALITFIAGATARGKIQGIGLTGPVQFYDPLVLDRTKNEIRYARISKQVHFEHEVDFEIYPTLEHRQYTSAEPAVLVLNAMIREANKAVSEIETECRKIGLIS
jgi:hypothetical protein